MPRIAPLRFSLSEKQKAFVFFTIKKLSTLSDKRHRQDIVKLALKFTPGVSLVYLQDWERRAIVQWLLKLHKMSQARKDPGLTDSFKQVLDALR